MKPQLDPIFVLSNQIEAAFWTILCVACLFATIRLKNPARRDAALAAVAFLAFGISDVIESTTGAWWRPWWLLMWKAACITTLLWLLIRYVRRRGA